MRGDVPGAFGLMRAAYEAGADPAQALSDLAAFTHLVTRIKLVPDAARDPSLTEGERVRGTAFAAGLSVRALSRAWQILLKALPEVAGSQRPLAAAEMVLVRVAYAADLPTPDEALRELREMALEGSAGGSANGPAGIPSDGPRSYPRSSAQAVPQATAQPISQMRSPAGGGSASPAPALAPAPSPAEMSAAAPSRVLALKRFEDVVALAGERRDIQMKAALERDVRLVRFEDGVIEFALAEGGSRSLPNDLSRALNDWTGRRWTVVLSSGEGDATLAERKRDRDSDRRRGAETHPLVQAVLASFPGAEIVNVTERAPLPEDLPAGPVDGGEAVPPDEATPLDD